MLQGDMVTAKKKQEKAYCVLGKYKIYLKKHHKAVLS